MALVPDWSRIANTTIHQFIRDEEVNILRNRRLLAMLQEKGRITFNHGGDIMDWKVRYKRSPMIGYSDSDTLTFSRRDRWKTAQLDWRGYAATDSMTKLERLKNKNNEAIIKVYSQIVTSLMDDLDDQFGDEFYIDGNAAGNSKRIHGVESFFSNSGAATNGFVGQPNSTYAGLLCTLGNYGGGWSTVSGNVNWPTGTGDAHYDFWSPIIVDYTNTSWSAGTKTFPNTGTEAVRYGLIHARKNKSKKGAISLMIFNDELYRQFIQAQATNERLVVKRGDKQSTYALGFEETLNFDGVDLGYEYGIPQGVGYGFPIEQMELKCLQEQMFVADDVDMDVVSQSYRFAVSFFGNLRCNPRYFAKWMKIS